MSFSSIRYGPIVFPALTVSIFLKYNIFVILRLSCEEPRGSRQHDWEAKRAGMLLYSLPDLYCSGSEDSQPTWQGGPVRVQNWSKEELAPAALEKLRYQI